MQRYQVYYWCPGTSTAKVPLQAGSTPVRGSQLLWTMLDSMCAFISWSRDILTEKPPAADPIHGKAGNIGTSCTDNVENSLRFVSLVST